MTAVQDDGASPLKRRSSLERAHRLLSSFDYDHRYLSLSELSRRTNTPLTTTHRLVGDLVALGMLERDVDGLLCIGVNMWRFGLLAPRTHGIQRIALPFMQDVYATTGMPVHLGVREDREVIFVESLRRRSEVDERPRLGSRYPLHVTSVGLAILAYMPQPFQDQYLEELMEEGDLALESEVRRDLAQVRVGGYAVSARMSAPAVSIGAPVLDRETRPVSAVSIIVPEGTPEASYAHLIRATVRSIQRTARDMGVD